MIRKTPKELLSDLTAETSLASLWWSARGFRSELTKYYRLGVAASFAAFAAATYPSRLTVSELGGLTRKMSEVGFGFAGTTFGILLAGFAIFATIGTSDLARRLAVLSSDGQMSEIKRMALHFTRAFVPLLVLCLVTFLVSGLCFYGGPVTLLASRLLPEVARALSVAAFAFIGALHIHVIVVLAAFVFNVHISLMTMVRARSEPSMEEAEKAAVAQLEGEGEAPQ